MILTRRAIAIGLVATAAADAPARPQQAAVELHITTDGDELAFKPNHLTCPSGADVRLVFHHTGEIINDVHDWILLKPGTRKLFQHDADREPDERVTVPRGDEYMVLAATGLCGRGHTVVVEFTAPAPGDYPFICSVPGHGETMNGTLTVTA